MRIWLLFLLIVSACGGTPNGRIEIATFKIDVTPPIGGALCDGLVTPAKSVADPLSAKGIVIYGAGKPIVLCAVDWVGIGNGGYDAWRALLAESVRTTVDRISVHCLHQHDAPGCDFESAALLARHGLPNAEFDVDAANNAILRAGSALYRASTRRVPITHLSFGKAKVKGVASNRRILGPDGKVAYVRFSKCADPKVRAMPEGLIDPWIRVIGFWNGDKPVAALSYYATHPQSYYGEGEVSCDFVGSARELMEAEHPGRRWIHFNGASGNVACGKYNDGKRERRVELINKLADGMRRAWKASKRVAVTAKDLSWKTVGVALPARDTLVESELEERLANKKLEVRERIRAARDLAWLRRAKSGKLIDLSCLSIGNVRVLNMPGELFVEHQLWAEQLRPDLHVCMAAYGDYGPGYIGTEIAYSQGGYETGRVSRVAPSVEGVLKQGIRQLLSAGDGQYLAGVASTDITPSAPIRLAGYASRTDPSDGVLENIHAKALALADASGYRVLLLTADLLGVTRAMSDTVCKALGLPRESVMIATSHTHTAPVLADHLAPMYDLSKNEKEQVEAYTRFVTKSLVEVGKKALADAKPARIAWGTGTCGFAVNRRNNDEADVPRLRAEGKLEGPVDHDVPVLRVMRDKKLAAVVFGYACHCTVLNATKVSGDYAGFAQHEFEKRHPGATALFFAGCGGDQNPLPRRRVDLAERYGRELADSVDNVLAKPMHAVSGRIQAAFENAPIAFDKLPSEAELRARLKDKNVYEQRRARYLLDRIAKDKKLAATYPVPVQAWQLGDGLTWVGLGGEVVVDYSRELKRELGPGKTWVAAYCNDVMAYIPSQRVWREGGYEGGGAMLYYGQPSRWAESVEDDLLAAVQRTVGRVRKDKPKTLADELPRIAPKSPKAALATFDVAPGYRIELVASEPNVVDPVDMKIDENGRIWVVEMRDYPFDERDGHEPEGRVRVLDDTDGDGRFDESHVFADKLSWPTALALWDGGVFVAAAPDILYLKDTSGDGRADVREVVFTGFGRNNVQTLVNNIVLTPDGWFVGAGGGNGGRIVSKRKPGNAPVLVRGRDFRFKPDGSFEALPGGGQFGNTIDAFGRRFVCNNSDHARQVVLDRLASIAVEGPAARVFRKSPPEPWRIVRTRWRLAGKVTGPIEHGGAVSGYFTSATGITSYQGDLIVGDVASNLVHRKTLSPDGVTFKAKRRTEGREFVASTDIWFRPVNFARGPDGALYVCDMYREVVEHPWSLPDSIKKHLDLSSGNDRGRIWRVVREGAAKYTKPNLGGASSADLVAALRRPERWWRDTAIRLLLERNDTSIAGDLAKLIASSASAETRVAALELLHGLGRLEEAQLLAALAADDARVVEVGVRLARELTPSPALAAALAKLVGHHEMRVRFELARTSILLPDATALPMLAELAARDGDNRWMRAAILGSLPGPRARALLARIQHVPAPFAAELCTRLGASREPEDTDAALDWIVTAGAHLGGVALSSLVTGMRRRGASLTDTQAAKLDGLFATWRKSAFDPKQSLGERQAWIRLFGLAPLSRCADTLAQLLDPTFPPELQTAAVKALGAHAEAEAAARLLREWSKRSPLVRRTILDVLIGRRSHASALLDAVEAGTVAAPDLGLRQREQLVRTGDAAFRKRANKLLGKPRASPRAEVIARYRPALAEPGDPERGRAVYENVCSECHRHGGRGKAIGPDLETVKDRTPDALLEQILDPNREVNPAYHLYFVETKDHRVVSGIVANETATEVELLRADGEKEVVLRSQIESMQTDGRSLMREDLEDSVTPAQMADLIAFLRR